MFGGVLQARVVTALRVDLDERVELKDVVVVRTPDGWWKSGVMCLVCGALVCEE